MARYTKTRLGTKGPGVGEFIGWDNAASGELSTEATHAADLGIAMTVKDGAYFGELAPGESMTMGRFEYQRD